MNIYELNKNYQKDLISVEGDKELRYYLLSPLFQNLYENKVVYHERFTCIVQLSKIVLTPELFEAKAERQLIIKTGMYGNRPLPEVWTIGANWAYLRLLGDYLAPYSSWLMWTDPGLVEKVEKLIQANNLVEAYNLTKGKNGKNGG
jgi:hypothetical protein